jgi:threonine dehydratase
LEVPDAPAEIYLKLEILQPVGSFKIRGAAAALTAFEPDDLAGGVWTVSAGNMGYALAWCARRLGVACSVVVPDDAPAAKLDAISAQGARLHPVPFARYQQIQVHRGLPGDAGAALKQALDGLTLIHPFDNRQVMAGAAGIALELLEDLPDVGAVLIPFGGGGLSCGIASAMCMLRPQARLLACEVETAAPLTASLTAGQQVEVTYTPSFVSGIGAPFVFPRMWPLAAHLMDGACAVTLEQVRRAMRVLAGRAHVVVEGAGAVSVAAALAGLGGAGKVACIVSGGNIDLERFSTILGGEAAQDRAE